MILTKMYVVRSLYWSVWNWRLRPIENNIRTKQRLELNATFKGLRPIENNIRTKPLCLIA